MTRHLTAWICGVSILAGCAEEPPPRSVTEFEENPILLEAAMIRCAEDRSKTRYDAECVNARQAVSRIQAREEAARAAELEAASENKRKALRRTQAAAAEARRRAAEERRLREEAEYLAQFGVLPPADDDSNETTESLPDGNVPVAVVPESTDDGSAPVEEPEVEPADSDLEAIRDELRRRNEEGQD